MKGKTVYLLGDRKLRGRGRDQLEPLKVGPSNSLTQTRLHFLKFPEPPKIYPALGIKHMRDSRRIFHIQPTTDVSSQT